MTRNEIDGIEYEEKAICPNCVEWFWFNQAGVEHYDLSVLAISKKIV